MVDRLVILADQAASCSLAGLTQLERLFLEVERWVAARGPAVPLPDVTVRWTAPNLRARQPQMTRRHSSLPYREAEAAAQGDASDEDGLVMLRTAEVWRPGGIAQHLSRLDDGDRSTSGPLGVLAGPGDASRLERLLFQSLGKPSDGFVTRWIHRPISTVVTRRLAGTPVTPNQVSIVVFALFAAASAVVIQGTFEAFVVGTILFKLGDILDGCDGELSRVKYLDSRFGAWLDTTVDMCGNMAFLVAIGIGLWRQAWPGGPGRAYHLHEALVTLAAQAGVIVAFARYTRRTSGAAHFAAFGLSLAQTAAGRWKQRAILGIAGLLRRDFYTWVFVLLAVTGQPQWILHGAAAIVAVHVPILLYAWSRR